MSEKSKAKKKALKNLNAEIVDLKGYNCSLFCGKCHSRLTFKGWSDKGIVVNKMIFLIVQKHTKLIV